MFSNYHENMPIWIWPLKPHFYIVKLGFTGYTLFSLFMLKNINCWYSLEPPRRGGFNEYPQFMFWAEMWKISEFLSENFHLLVVKFSVYLNRRVLGMVLNEYNEHQWHELYKLEIYIQVLFLLSRAHFPLQMEILSWQLAFPYTQPLSWYCLKIHHENRPL